MPSTRGWRLWPLAGLIVVVGVAGSVLVTVTVTPGGILSDIVQTVASVLTVTGGLVLWLWTRSRRQVPTSTDILARAGDALAAAVSTQWERAAVERRLRYPAPIPVQWRWSHQAVTGPIDEALSAVGQVRFAPLPGMAAATLATVDDGGLGDLFKVYAGLDSGRVIVLGGAGCGKSAAGILTMLDGLRHRRGLDDTRREAVPVPVLLTAHGWDPRHQRLSEWFAARLEAEYPFLRSAFGRDVAGGLVDGGWVALVLDGFDEIADELRPAAIRALDQQATFRLMVLTRTRELVDAVAAGHLHGAAALELLPVPAKEAADYLLRCQIQPPPPAWQRLAEHLRAAPDSPVSAALDNPLMLTLVRDTFPDPDDLDDLLTAGRFANRADVEDHLLNRVLPAAYQSRPGARPAPYSLEQARRWLGFLATEMNHRDTRDIAWWHIRHWAPATHRVVTMAISSTLGFGLTIGLIFGLNFGLVTGVVAGLVCGLSNGVAVGLAEGLRGERGNGDVFERRRLGGSRAISPGLAGGLASGFSAGVAAGVAVGLTRGLVAGVMVGSIVALGFGLVCGATEWLLEARRRAGPRRLRPLRWNAVASKPNLAAGLTYGLIFTWIFGLAFGLARDLAFGLFVGGLAVGLTGALLFWIVNALAQGAANTNSPMDPVTSWRRDRQSELTEGIANGLLGLIGFGFTGWIMVGTGTGLALGLSVGLGIGLLFALAASQSWLATITFRLLNRAGLFPSQGIRFLEDARQRGVLRTTGLVYQFRHARLQDRLATAHAPTPSTLTQRRPRPSTHQPAPFAEPQ